MIKFIIGVIFGLVLAVILLELYLQYINKKAIVFENVLKK